MSADIPRWAINLDQPPQVRFAAVMSGNFIGTQRFLLPEHWAVHFYDYHATLVMGGHRLAIRPRTASVTPANVPVEYHWPKRSSHDGLHVRLAAVDPARVTELVSVPALQDLGRDFSALRRQFVEAVGCLQTQPRRAQVRFWDILWQLATRSPPEAAQSAGMHPAVRRAVEYIELHLAQPIRAAQLARHVELSHNQLTRLFRAALGTTIVGYLRKRRVERAEHLLSASTLPVKAIAAEVGLPDLQRFNKLVRRELGVPPRLVRRTGR